MAFQICNHGERNQQCAHRQILLKADRALDPGKLCCGQCDCAIVGEWIQDMKSTNEKCLWVIPREERRVAKLLRLLAKNRDVELVANSSNVRRFERRVRICVSFAEEKLSAFEPLVRLITKSLKMAF
jgi:hypothetical protein